MPVRPKPVATSSQIEKHVVRVAQPAHRPQVARRLEEHARRTLHQRLHHDRGDLVLVLCQHLLQRGRVAGGHAVRIEQQRPVHRVEQVDPADRDRTNRVAVVGVLEAHEARA